MFEWITNNVEGIISIVAQVVGVFAVIAIGDSEAYTEANALALAASGGLEGDPNF